MSHFELNDSKNPDPSGSLGFILFVIVIAALWMVFR